MLATVGGFLALLLGFLALLLPLLAPELSRPRDAFWGAVVLLLGLVLVTSADRLMGAPMLAVLCGGLLIGRLGTEVVQLRWRQLTPEEQGRLGSTERWRTSFGELTTALTQLAVRAAAALQVIGGSLGSTLARQPRTTGKRWVRPEGAAAEPPEASPTQSTHESAPVPVAAPEAPEPDPIEVGSFAEIDSLIRQHHGGENDAEPGPGLDAGPAEGERQPAPPPEGR
jgi:hypothetical protein